MTRALIRITSKLKNVRGKTAGAIIACTSSLIFILSIATYKQTNRSFKHSTITILLLIFKIYNLVASAASSLE